MDSQKIGGFIAEARKAKGMTQLELAKVLHVTDKAVSKWERGIGFPDMKLIKPLAQALEVSVLELINGEYTGETEISSRQAETAVGKVIDEAVYQRRLDRRSLIATVSTVVSAVMISLLIENDWFAFLSLYLPLTCLGTGVALIVTAIIRACRHKKFAWILVSGMLLLAVPFLKVALFILFFALGLGPVPT